MAIYIDSAIIEEVKSAGSLGWVRGVTTNPVLLAKAGGEARDVLSALAHLNMGSLFYQLASPTVDGMFEEMRFAADVVGRSLILKVPPTENGFRFVAQCSEYPCCVTAIFSPAQALIASQVNARYVAIYVNRATRLLGDGLKLVKDVAEIRRHSSTEIIAASIKSSEEACAALYAGAHHLTLPYEVLTSLSVHPLSEQTVAEFQSKGLGINSSKQEELLYKES
jgi:transaldolase